MFSAVFWNIGNRSPKSGIVKLIAGLQRQSDADIVILAECSAGVLGSVLRALNNHTTRPQFWIVTTSSRVQVLRRNTIRRVQEIAHHDYYSLLTISRHSQSPDLLLAAVHMVSLLTKDSSHIDTELTNFANDIRKVENSLKHKQTIVLGDLNAHPFSEGVCSSAGLHGVMSQQIAKRIERQASHRTYPYFFNPMWQFYGDPTTTTPSGTYYREASGEHTAYYWHLFDQVLLRPSLLPFYTRNSVCIITSIEGTTLATQDGRPNTDIGSDHFPISLKLNC